MFNSHVYKKHHRYSRNLQNEVQLVVSTDSLKICEREGGEQNTQKETNVDVVLSTLNYSFIPRVLFLLSSWNGIHLLHPYFLSEGSLDFSVNSSFRKFCTGFYLKSKQNSEEKRKIKLLHQHKPCLYCKNYALQCKLVQLYFDINNER